MEKTIPRCNASDVLRNGSLYQGHRIRFHGRLVDLPVTIHRRLESFNPVVEKRASMMEDRGGR